MFNGRGRLGNRSICEVAASEAELAARIQLDTVPGLGPRRMSRLYRTFGSASNVKKQNSRTLQAVDGIGPSLASGVVRTMKGPLTEASSELKRYAEGSALRLVGFPDTDYSVVLREIHSPPSLLWLKGTLTDLNQPCIAIVGTRRASAYGRRTAHRLAFELASEGVVVVSGLAYGIDAAAHEGALDAGGQTIAVLGSGIEEIYPRTHKDLAARITGSGCLVSELHPRARPKPEHFPIRNRIISGLCPALIIVEAFEKAGALITARSALDEGRDLYIVPGRIDEETSTGTNLSLLRGEGQILCSAEQVLTDYRERNLLASDAASREQTPSLSAEISLRSAIEKVILDHLSQSEMHIDELDRQLDFPASELWVALLNLECDGLIRALPGNLYEATRRSVNRTGKKRG